MLLTKLPLVGKVALHKKNGKSKQNFYVRLDNKQKLLYSVGEPGLGIWLKNVLSHMEFINNFAISVKAVTRMKRKKC